MPSSRSPGIRPRKRAEVVDARDLEPDEVDGVVRDALRVGLREAHPHLGREAEAPRGELSTIGVVGASAWPS